MKFLCGVVALGMLITLVDGSCGSIPQCSFFFMFNPTCDTEVKMCALRLEYAVAYPLPFYSESYRNSLLDTLCCPPSPVKGGGVAVGGIVVLIGICVCACCLCRTRSGNQVKLYVS